MVQTLKEWANLTDQRRMVTSNNTASMRRPGVPNSTTEEEKNAYDAQPIVTGSPRLVLLSKGGPFMLDSYNIQYPNGTYLTNSDGTRTVVASNGKNWQDEQKKAFGITNFETVDETKQEEAMLHPPVETVAPMLIGAGAAAVLATGGAAAAGLAGGALAAEEATVGGLAAAGAAEETASTAALAGRNVAITAGNLVQRTAGGVMRGVAGETGTAIEMQPLLQGGEAASTVESLGTTAAPRGVARGLTNIAKVGAASIGASGIGLAAAQSTPGTGRHSTSSRPIVVPGATSTQTKIPGTGETRVPNDASVTMGSSSYPKITGHPKFRATSDALGETRVNVDRTGARGETRSFSYPIDSTLLPRPYPSYHYDNKNRIYHFRPAYSSDDRVVV